MPHPHAAWLRRTHANDPFPSSYLCFDTETTGLSFGADLVTQVGYCVVSGREVVADGSLMLDWSRDDRIDQHWLADRLAQTKYQMESRGKTCHMTYERLRAEGVDPSLVLEVYKALLDEARARGDAFLAHNAWGFDIPMLHAMYQRFTPEPFAFRHAEVYDTGVMLKAAKLGEHPRPGEARQEFYKRIHSRRAAGVTWSLDRAAAPEFGLEEKYGLDMASAHDAGFDCRVTALLLEEYHRLAEGAINADDNGETNERAA